MKYTQDMVNIFQLLSDFFKKENINYVLIGATVPLILIDLKERNGKGFGIRPTKDLDFTIIIKNWKSFTELKKSFQDIGLIQKENHPEHKFFYNNFQIDIIPYNKELVKDGYLTLPESHNKINVTGFDKLFKYAKLEKFADNLLIPVIPLPLFVYTKILAYTDRELTKDLEDITYCLQHYEEASVSERRFDIVGQLEISYEISGAYLLGKELSEILSVQEKEIVQNFINEIQDEYSPLILKFVSNDRERQKEVFEFFISFKKGIIL